jgi:hypothetical protein
MRKTLPLLLSFGATALTASAAVTSIAVTGYNRDIVVEAGAPVNAAGVTDATMDGGAGNTGGTWYAQGFNTSAPTTGLPAAGSTIVSLLAADHSYTFPISYGPGNGAAGLTPNAFVVGQNSGSPTVGLVTPQRYSTLSLIGSAGHGPVTVNYVINFADATTQSGTISTGDWFNGSAAYNSNGRLTVNTGAFDNVNAGNPRLYTFDFAVTNTASPVTSITLSSASTTGTAAFFALSGTAVPEPSSLLTAGLTAFALLSSRRRSAGKRLS